MINLTKTNTMSLLLWWLVTALQATMASSAAAPTRSLVIPPDAQSPRPTEPPNYFDLGRRQNGFTYLVAPDRTCGWVSGSTATFWTCGGSNMRCVFWLADGSLPGRHACCPEQGCLAFNRFSQTACVSRDESCDAACTSNGRVAKCTGTASPYCHTRFWGSSGGFPSFSCGNTSWANPRVYLTIKPGTTRFFATSTSLATASTTTTTSGGSVITRVVTVTGPSASDQANGGGGGGGDEDTKADDARGGGGQPAGDSDSGAANTGAIVGGAVGGAAVLVIAAMSAVFFYRWRRKNKAEAASPGPPGGYYPVSPSHQDSTFTPSPYATTSYPAWGSTNVSPAVNSPPNAPQYAGAYPKYPAPMAEVDGTGANRVHEMGTN